VRLLAFTLLVAVSAAQANPNHPKNKRDPMICLNGECYVSYYNKPAW